MLQLMKGQYSYLLFIVFKVLTLKNWMYNKSTLKRFLIKSNKTLVKPVKCHTEHPQIIENGVKSTFLYHFELSNANANLIIQICYEFWIN